MSDSYPIIQESLSDMQKEFMGCVEMHVDPPELGIEDYRIESLYRFDEPESGLPGRAIRFAITAASAEDDVVERRHMVEFLSPDGDRVGHIRHSLKRVEASQGAYFFTESQFEVDGPEFPRRQVRQDKVEEEVKVYLDLLRVLDRERKLLELVAEH